MRARTAIAAVLGLWLAVGAVVAIQPWGRPGGPDDGDDFSIGSPNVRLASLTPFGACTELEDYVKEHALEQVTPYGLGGGYPMEMFDVVATEEAAADTAGDPAPMAMMADGANVRDSDTSGGSGPMDVDFSGTNVAVAGVDEPDIVKTDGRILYTSVDDRIRALDISGAQPVELGQLALEGEPWGRELLLAGDRLLVLGTAFTEGRPGMPMPIEGDGGIGDARLSIMPIGSSTATLTLVDVSDPADMRVLETLTLEGQYLSARLVDGIARVVVRAEPVALPFVYPQTGGLQAEEEALERNREVIRSSTAEQWLPYYIHTRVDGERVDGERVDGERVDGERGDGDGGERTEGTLLDCESVHRPGEFSGFGTINVLSIDPAQDLRPDGATAVLAGGETIAASADRLYVATNRWTPVAMSGTAIDDRVIASEELSTEVHAFDITQPTARYVASGSVPGHLLNQFSMSEHEGLLRIATTENPSWGGDEPQESRVAVLAERGDALQEIGAVGGLGRDERIYAVRFLGEIAYVVTFRETDPLYTVDLSDPTAPRVRGELKIPGFSSYLHPLGDGLLLGVGQDATEDGMILGAQISLFDVSDLDNPQRISTLSLGEQSSTDAEYDHRAFLYWPSTGLGVLPVQRWGWDEKTQTEDIDSAAVGFVAEGGALREVGRASHLEPPAVQDAAERTNPDMAYRSSIRRSVVTGDSLITISERGLLISDLDSFTPSGFAAFSR